MTRMIVVSDRFTATDLTFGAVSHHTPDVR